MFHGRSCNNEAELQLVLRKLLLFTVKPVADSGKREPRWRLQAAPGRMQPLDKQNMLSQWQTEHAETVADRTCLASGRQNKLSQWTDRRYQASGQTEQTEPVADRTS